MPIATFRPAKNLVFLTCSQTKVDIEDDRLVEPYLEGYKISEIDWRQFNPDPKLHDAVLIRTTWDYHLHLDEFLKVLKKIEAVGIPLMNSSALVQWNSNKSYLKELEALGVAIPHSNFFKLESIEHLLSMINSKSDWILKPQVSLSAHNTFWIRSETQVEDLKKCFAALEGIDVILQVFCKEVLDPGEISLLFFKNELSHATLKTPKSGDFRVQAEHGGNIRHYQPSDHEIQTAQKILEKIPFPWLYARVDMIPTASELLLMELELIEPSLYFRTNAEAPKNFARAIKSWIY